MARRSFPIAVKVDLIIIVSLVVGIGAGISVLAVRQYTAAINSTDDALGRQAQIIYFSIKNKFTKKRVFINNRFSQFFRVEVQFQIGPINSDKLFEKCLRVLIS